MVARLIVVVDDQRLTRAFRCHLFGIHRVADLASGLLSAIIPRAIRKRIGQLRNVVPVLALLHTGEIAVVQKELLELDQHAVTFEVDVVIDIEETFALVVLGQPTEKLLKGVQRRKISGAKGELLQRDDVDEAERTGRDRVQAGVRIEIDQTDGAQVRCEIIVQGLYVVRR